MLQARGLVSISSRDEHIPHPMLAPLPERYPARGVPDSTSYSPLTSATAATTGAPAVCTAGTQGVGAFYTEGFTSAMGSRQYFIELFLTVIYEMLTTTTNRCRSRKNCPKQRSIRGSGSPFNARTARFQTIFKSFACNWS